ncbi:uncharacterized protein [Solanum lycopersicum]|uniref:uncharacterized protein n=1 Tax=Solanum lycopersicum TaxID=4081 RepID=UPI0002BCBFFE|nr:uncharacterized protein LOC109119533 [Solanum lycopersicum]
MVVEMRSRLSLFVVGLSRQSIEEDKEAMLIEDMDLERFMINVQQVEEDKLKDIDELQNKRSETSGKKFRQQKSDANRHILSECPESRQGSGNQGNMDQSSPVSPPDIATPRWDASSTGGGTKHL